MAEENLRDKNEWNSLFLSCQGWQRSKLEQRAKKRERELVAEAASTESEPSPKRLPQNRQRTLPRDAGVETPSEKEVEDG